MVFIPGGFASFFSALNDSVCRQKVKACPCTEVCESLQSLRHEDPGYTIYGEIAPSAIWLGASGMRGHLNPKASGFVHKMPAVDLGASEAPDPKPEEPGREETCW